MGLEAILTKKDYGELWISSDSRSSLQHLNKWKLIGDKAIVSYRVLKMEVKKEKIRYILQFFFDKGENANQVAGLVNGVYGTVAANYVQFWFRRFR
ncbi:hypothetical protein TNCV_3764371 [Trichonephila clavipes]|uniref:Mos1 transposase HTH domain-containing protein n=1 Tax=Trichonephila clavipes TaxID=2585209 RepID=A0A8X6VVB7_TRICX|nr:hypothetical protein TNCV_3764371 [Trichonephila clavipes]